MAYDPNWKPKTETYWEETFFFSDRKFTTPQDIDWHELKDKDSVINKFKEKNSVKATLINTMLDRDGYIILIATLFYIGDKK